MTALKTRLAKQYDEMAIRDGIRDRGQTANEDSADFVGVRMAADALYDVILFAGGDLRAKAKAKMKITQDFCFAFARTFEAIAQDVGASDGRVFDGHSPFNLRVNGVLQSTDEFHEVFGVREGDQMYRGANNRIRIF